VFGIRGDGGVALRQAEFRWFLADRLGPRTADNYVSNCNRVRKTLALDLDTCDMSVIGLSNLRRQLEAARVPPRSANECLSAIKAYAEFRGVARPAPGDRPCS